MSFIIVNILVIIFSNFNKWEYKLLYSIY